MCTRGWMIKLQLRDVGEICRVGCPQRGFVADCAGGNCNIHFPAPWPPQTSEKSGTDGRLGGAKWQTQVCWKERFLRHQFLFQPRSPEPFVKNESRDGDSFAVRKSVSQCGRQMLTSGEAIHHDRGIEQDHYCA